MFSGRGHPGRQHSPNKQEKDPSAVVLVAPPTKRFDVHQNPLQEFA
jgi:hypothetical protein